ncbi:MAG TPA: MMPL family transporter [Acidimicrobiales bacterium]
MNEVWRALGRALSRRTAVVLGAVLVITALFALGLPGLEFATGQDSYLAPDDPAAIDNERYQDLFGGEAMVSLLTMDEGTTVADLFTEENIRRFEELEEQLRASDASHAVVSPLTPLQWAERIALSGVGVEILERAAARETDPDGVEARAEANQITSLRLAQAGEQSLSNPDWVEFLLYANDGFELTADGELASPPDDERVIRGALLSAFPDPRHALFVTFLQGNASLEELGEGDDLVSDAFADITFDNADFIVTGTPTFLTDINDYLQGGMLTLGLIAVVVMLVVLGLAFRVRWRLLPLGVVLAGIVWAFGLFGFLGLDLSLVTISGLPILIGIGIDFAIQVHNRAEEESALDRERFPLAETVLRLGPLLAMAMVAAVIAFLSMRFSLVPMIQDFGLLLSIGIAAMLVVGIVVPTAVLGARERRRRTTEVRPSRIDRVVMWLGSAPPVVVLPLVVVALVLPIIGLALEQDAEIESDPINWADQDSRSVVNARILEDQTGYATTLGIFIETSGVAEGGIFTDQMGAFSYGFVRAAQEEHPKLAASSSLFTTVGSLIAVPGASPLPPTEEDLLAAYEVAPADIQDVLVANDGNAAQVTFWVGPSSLEERADLVDDLEAAIARPGDGQIALPENASATPSGLARVGVGLLENLTANRLVLTVVALLGVAAWVVLRFLSLGRAVLTMIPILIAVGAASTGVSLLGITLSPLTTVSGPLVIATCAEFSVLILGRFLEERQRGLDPSEATHMASRRTGRAFVASALTTVGGFGVLLFAALPLLQDFGAVVTINVAVALLAALVVVPPAAVWADRRGLLETSVAGVPRARRATAVAVGLLLLAAAVTVSVVVADEEAEAGPGTPSGARPPATAEPSAAEQSGG